MGKPEIGAHARPAWIGHCPHCGGRLFVEVLECGCRLYGAGMPAQEQDLTEASKAPDGGSWPIDCDYQEDATLDPPPR